MGSYRNHSKKTNECNCLYCFYFYCFYCFSRLWRKTSSQVKSIVCIGDSTSLVTGKNNTSKVIIQVVFPAAKLIQWPSLWSQGEVVTNRMWCFAIHCHSHGMHVWSHDPLCCADAEPTRGEGCASRSLQSLNYCGRKKKGTACSLTTTGLSTKIWTCYYNSVPE